MFVKGGAIAALFVIMWSGVLAADEADMRDRIRYLEERLQVLEGENSEPGEMLRTGSPIRLSGLLEVEAAAGKDHQGSESSDVSLAALELVAEAHVNYWIHAQIVYLFEEDDTELGEIDQGFLTFGNAEVFPFYLAAGRKYMPFGNYVTGMVSDPLTLELGETRESALQVGFGWDGLYGSTYLFNGDSQKTGDEDMLMHFGANLGYATKVFDIGAAYISSLADSDTIQATLVTIDTLQKKVAGVAAYVNVKAIPFTMIGEYVGANGEFDTLDLAFNNEGARPSAWNLEVDYGFHVMGKEASFGVARQQTAEAVALGLPESKTLAALSIGLTEKSALGFEFASAVDYSTSDGGSGEKGNTVTLQWAAEF